MFCKNCGMENKNEAAFCANCGTPITNSVMQASQPAIPKKNKKVVGIIACLLAVAIVAVGCVAIINALNGDSYEEVARKYAIAEANGDYEEMVKYVPFEDIEEMISDYFEYLCKISGKSMDELYEQLEKEYNVSVNNLDDVIKCSKLAQEKNLEKTYGDYTISAKVIDSEKLSESDLEDIIDKYESDTIFDIDDYLDTDKIKTGYEVEVKIKIKGDEKSDSSVKTYTVVKYNGKWKVLYEE